MKEEIEMLVSLALQVKLTPKQQKFIEQICGWRSRPRCAILPIRTPGFPSGDRLLRR